MNGSGRQHFLEAEVNRGRPVTATVTRQKNASSMSLRLPHIVDVRRPFGNEIRGYVLERNSQVLVIREFDGFLPDGFAVLPSSTVTELSINERWTEMIASEGHSSLATAKPPFSADNIRTVLDYLISNGMSARLDCENCSGAEHFGSHFGRVVKKYDARIDLVFFDTTGRWSAGAYSIPIQSISQIVLYSRYVDTFAKYLGPCPQ